MHIVFSRIVPDMIKFRWLVLAMLILTTIVVWIQVGHEQPEGVLTVSFLDVGQGDATLITAPNGNQVLIDGGRDKQVLSELGRELGFFDRDIDIVIATHPDGDHIGGLPDVLRRYDVDRVFVSGNDSADTLQDVFHDRAGTTIELRVGDVINLGGGVYLRTLFPDRDVTHIEPNDASIILQLVYGETAFMLTGDAPSSVEEYVSWQFRETLASDVLKVGHHGSKTSSHIFFVGLVDPDHAVVSAGCNNRYGHPHKEVVATFESFEIPLLTTCDEGTVVFESDGVSVTRLD